MSDDMVERVARAIADATLSGDWRLFTDEARAAIEALRKPTEAMVRAALDADLDIYWEYRSDGSPGGPEDVWETMIDAALATPPEPQDEVTT